MCCCLNADARGANTRAAVSGPRSSPPTKGASSLLGVTKTRGWRTRLCGLLAACALAAALAPTAASADVTAYWNGDSGGTGLAGRHGDLTRSLLTASDVFSNSGGQCLPVGRHRGDRSGTRVRVADGHAGNDRSHSWPRLYATVIRHPLGTWTRQAADQSSDEHCGSNRGKCLGPRATVVGHLLTGPVGRDPRRS